MKAIAILNLAIVAFFVLLFVAGFDAGRAYQLRKLREQMVAQGAVGTPGNALGLPGTNVVTGK